jgi:hypothetical protein
LREHIPIFEAVGLLGANIEERKRQYAQLGEVSIEGTARRKRLADALDYTSHEYLAHGSEMNQRYRSDAVYSESGTLPLPIDPVLHHDPDTYPGSRLPHAWLNTSTPGQQISTIDLAGNGMFTLFVGIGGTAWIEAAETIYSKLGVKITTVSVGPMQEYEAVYNHWYRLRKVSEKGCVLVRPDKFVAWRSMDMVEDCEAALSRVLRKILFL